MSKKKTTEEKTTPETMDVRMTESYATFVSRESVTITIADYPELEGMSEDEIKDYIQSNSYDMKSPYEWADSLGDALMQMDVIREKITDENTEIFFD
jgi:hypothetical protein